MPDMPVSAFAVFAEEHAGRSRAGAPLPAAPDRPCAPAQDHPGKVFDLQLLIADVAEGYRAMAERRAIKTLLRV
jgi:hypothetical protein